MFSSIVKKKLDISGYNTGAKHSELQHQARQLSIAKSSLSQLRLKLGVYSDLTPDLALVRLFYIH